MKKIISLWLITLIVQTCCFAQWVQTGPRLFDPNGSGIDLQATSAVISDDGSTAVVGRAYGVLGSGGFSVYTRNGNQWSQQFSYTGNPLSNMGGMITTSRDGSTIAIGNASPYSNNNDSIWVFTRAGAIWELQFSTRITTGITSLGLSNDGNTMLTSCIVWARNNNQWTREDTLQFTDSLYNSYIYNTTILSADGNTAVVNAGPDWVFVRNGNQWVQQAKLVPSVPMDTSANFALNYLGAQISGDGNTLLSSFRYNQSAGWVTFDRVGNTWTQDTAYFIDYYSNGSLSYDGSTIFYQYSYGYQDSLRFAIRRRLLHGWAVESPITVEKYFDGQVVWDLDSSGTNAIMANSFTDTAYGGAWLINYNGNTWQTQAHVFESGALGHGQQGISTVISADGTTMAYAGKQNGYGKVWIYIRNASQWVLQTGLTRPPTSNVDRVSFGGGFPMEYTATSLALSANGTTLAVAAPANGIHDASVFIYVRTGNAWSLQTELSSATFLYAHAVSLSDDGNTLLVGNGAQGVGADVYVRNGTTWSLQGVLNYQNGNADLVMLTPDGNTAVLAEHYYHQQKGAMHVFRRTGNNWSLEQCCIYPPQISNYTAFPTAMAISRDGNHIAGTQGNNGPPEGNVYTYSRQANHWTASGDICSSFNCIGNGQHGQGVLLSETGDTLFEVASPSYYAHVYKINAFVRNGSQWNFAYQFPLLDDSTYDVRNQNYMNLGASADLRFFTLGVTICANGDGGVYTFERNNFNISAVENKPTTCPYNSDGKLKLTFAGLVPVTTVQWSTGLTGVDSITNLSTGIYTVTVTGANAISIVRQYTVTSQSNMSLNNVATNLPCNSNGGTIALTVVGGKLPYAYQWNTTPVQTGATVLNLQAGLYEFTVTDSLGCVLNDTAEMAANFYWASVTATQPNCTNNGSATVTMHGGVPPYNYLWSGGSTAATDSLLGPGVYSVTIHDGNACSITGTAQLGNFCGNLISGKVFFDTNDNCVLDSNETGAPVYNVFATNGNYIAYGSTDGTGNYEIAVPTSGSFSVFISQWAECGFMGCSGSIYPLQAAFAGTNDTVANVNFALVDTAYDLSLQVQGSVLNPGFNGNFGIYYGDLQNQNIPTGVVTLVYDSLLSFNGSIPPYASFDALTRTVTWNVTNIGLLASFNQFISVDFTLAQVVSGRTWAIADCFIQPVADDCNTGNNHLLAYLPVVSSLDPNMKESSTRGKITDADTTIEYTIHFQNTGTDSTHFIIVTDTLSEYLEPGSVQTLATSHMPYIFKLEGSGVVSWRFEPCELPDSTTDAVNSQGFVTFRVKRKPNLQWSTLIANTAHIYFDYNTPVKTNTVADSVQNPLNILITQYDDILKIYPNPAGQFVNVLITESGPFQVSVFDSKGAKIVTKYDSGNRTTIDVRTLANGIYMLEVALAKGIRRGKLVKLD